MPFAFMAPAPRRFAEPAEPADDLAGRVADDETAMRRAFLSSVRAMLTVFDDGDTGGGISPSLISDMIGELERQLSDRAAPIQGQSYLTGATFARDRLPRDARLGVRFDLVNPKAVEWADLHTGAMVTQVSDQTRKAIRATIRQALDDGLPPSEVARRIRSLIGLTERDALAVGRLRTRLEDEDRAPDQVERMTTRYANRLLRRRAQTIARHETMQAANAGQLGLWRQSVDDGLLLESEWERRWITAHDERTCPICKPLDGTRAPMLTGAFPGGYGQPPAHVTCLPGSTKVSPAGRITAATKRWYDGELVIIRTASGKQLSCTPNHPILTPVGWVAAGLLDVGGHVVSSALVEWLPSRDLNDQDVPPSIEEVADSFRQSGEMIAVPVPTTTEDFHGDGEGSQVAVVWSDRELRDGRYPALSQHLPQTPFVGSLFREGALPLQSIPDEQAFRAGYPASCVVRRADLVRSLLRSHASPLQGLGLTLAARSDAGSEKAGAYSTSGDAKTLGDRILRKPGYVSRHNIGIGDVLPPPALSALDSSLLQTVVDDDARDTKLASDLLAGAAGPVFADDVVSVYRESWHGFVFNLETESGAYTAEGIITHNCRCTTGLVRK